MRVCVLPTFIIIIIITSACKGSSSTKAFVIISCDAFETGLAS